MRHPPRISLAALFVAIVALGCGDDDEATAPENLPADHTVVLDGQFHAPGLNDPQANCASCHGADLMGGNDGEPSCFACHGRKWP